YEYEWADKYLIATFPSRHYDIELYPAVKRHLLSFGKERLEQTGKTYSINGEKIKARKKTHNKWFETQDSISYWEDFMRPKIIWKRIGSILRFSYDTTGNFGLDSTCFATGQHMAYLCCILNSLMGHYMFKDSPKTGTGDLLVSVQAIEPILIPMNKDMECLFENLLEEVLEHRSEETEKEINRLAFKLYDLSPAEINYITDFVTQSQQSQ
ncbi:type II restriction endonuclease, partial [Bacteroides fragilis]|nr:type II restriction endonuclease [Bacteroides fragilis]MCE8702842.1 type II restriction endonuclease [Bacteroides fragilis]MCE9450028.1 type II restriction endonuclease [Bacteroides fragilis]